MDGCLPGLASTLFFSPGILPEAGIKFSGKFMKDFHVSPIQRSLQIIQEEGIRSFIQKLLAKILRSLRPGKQSPKTTGILQGLTGEAYRSWLEQNELTSTDLVLQTELAANLPYKPLISIILPVYNPPASILEQALASVLSQTYPNWELCIADGDSPQAAVQELLSKFAQVDQRIRLKFLNQNLGISGNSNAALEFARGEFMAFLDQDDILAPDALFEIAQALNQTRTLDMLYSDHDLLEFDGPRKQPLFKPDWSPEIMLSANFITHLTVARASLVREVGGFDPALDGAQDWDLFLKISEKTGEIAHIPKILYHWRDSQDSTASNIWSKSYAPPSQLQAIRSHLTRLGLPDAEAFFDPSGYIRVRWKFNREKKVSIIIPSNGASKMLEGCVASILNSTDYPHFEILIVNNGPKRPEEFPYFQKVSADPRVRVIHDDRPFNYSAVNNFGAQHASGEIFLFLNNDTEMIAPDWLDEMVMWSEREAVGIVGAKLLYPDGSIQHAGVIIGLTGFAGHVFAGQPEYEWTIFGLAEWYRNYNAVTAACMMITRQVFEQIGGFDETFILCGSDVEICLRTARSGRRIVYNPFARLRHLEGATRASDVPAQDYRISYQHYLPFLQAGDPFFNPSLSYWQLRPTLALPDEPSPLEFVMNFLEQLKGTAKIENHP